MNRPSALIFDMDDLLVRSAPIWKAAEQKLLREIGQTWTFELAARYKGLNALDVARVIHEFEDSLVGVRAARASGMRCFSVPSGHHAEIAKVATRTFPSLADISLADAFPG